MIVKLLTKHHLEFLSLKGGCRGLSESILVKMSNCWKSHAAAQVVIVRDGFFYPNPTHIMYPFSSSLLYHSFIFKKVPGIPEYAAI